MGAFMDPLAWTDTAMGGLTASVEAKLVDFADAGYYASNNPPQGEVWLRGPTVTDGYLDLPQETEENFTKDGWFKTGDIGEWDKYGNLRMIDRKKNLVKTINGEYIALEKVLICDINSITRLTLPARIRLPIRFDRGQHLRLRRARQEQAGCNRHTKARAYLSSRSTKRLQTQDCRRMLQR